MKLSPMISEGCVLQHGQKNRIWGEAAPGKTVLIQLWRQKDRRPLASVLGRADVKGEFEVYLPQVPAGTGFYLTAEEKEENFLENGTKTAGEESTKCSTEKIIVENVAFGNVFLLSGQSNMVLPVSRTLDVTEEKIKDMDYPDIREFAVPMEPVFGRQLTSLGGGSWKKAQGEEILAFGAAGFFMACDLYEKNRLPIGLVQTATGGTPIQAWCSEETIKKFGEYTEELERCYDSLWIEKVQREEAEREAAWHKKAWPDGEMVSETVLLAENETEAGLKQRNGEGLITIPGLWHGTELEGFHGSLILERDFTLEDLEKADKEEGGKARVYIGAIVDADKVYINEEPVGETGYCYPPRKYDFPAEILKKGKNHIRVEMMVFRETGGFIPDKPYYVRCGKTECSLAGEWHYRIVRRMEELPQTTFFQYKPSALYNGMLFPLRGISLKGMLFYQGESNTHKPEGYQKYFDAALKDWRKLFGNTELPVVYVQLAGFADCSKPCTATNWAVLREEQRRSLANTKIAMVTAVDIGEYNDLHPQKKDILGSRLALAVRSLIYGENVEYSGPVCEAAKADGNCVKLIFSHAEKGMESLCGGSRIYGVELAGGDGVFYEAEAYIEGECLQAFSPFVERPRKCRYAWNNFPERANLCNWQKLPAVPFAVEIPSCRDRGYCRKDETNDL